MTQLVTIVPFNSPAGKPNMQQLKAFVEKLDQSFRAPLNVDITLGSLSGEGGGYHANNRVRVAELAVTSQQHGNPLCTSVLVDPNVFDFIQVEDGQPIPPAGCVPVHFKKGTREFHNWESDADGIEQCLRGNLPRTSAAGTGCFPLDTCCKSPSRSFCFSQIVAELILWGIIVAVVLSVRHRPEQSVPSSPTPRPTIGTSALSHIWESSKGLDMSKDDNVKSGTLQMRATPRPKNKISSPTPRPMMDTSAVSHTIESSIGLDSSTGQDHSKGTRHWMDTTRQIRKNG